MLIVLAILQTWADPVYVVGHADYVLLFLAGGATWIFLVTRCLAVVGLSARDDAIERNNPAAVAAVCGAFIGVSLAYAGSNIGNGPTIWTTLVPALAAAASLLALWCVAEVLGPASDAITIDRDLATGIRVAAFAVAAGAVLGRAMAGDWHSWNDTFGGFVLLGWPAVAIALLLAVSNRLLGPTTDRPEPGVITAGVMPAAVLLLATTAYLATLGAPQVALPERSGPQTVELP
jgi:uncharacterized membrane protein YjfL (UPF0719 family)